jgi:flagellar biosynthesis/type III secretory pathway chaperone
MESLKRKLRRYRDVAGLARRVADLEEEVQECRQLNLRLAELCDVTMELLLPTAARDEDQIAEILTRYREDVSDPVTWLDRG